MTGIVFATFSKFIEIGNIVTKIPGYEGYFKDDTTSFIGSQMGKKVLLNKRSRKQAQKEQSQKEISDKKSKHYSSVQNKPISLEAL